MPITQSSAARPVKRVRRQRLFARRPVILVIVFAMLAGAVYLWIVRPQPPVTTPRSSESGEVTTTESSSSNDPIARVAGHLLVNPDEKPYVATITDLEAARKVNPSFYQNAELGDKVLFWSDKAVIYSPTKDRIVSVISIVDTSKPAAPSATSSVFVLENVTLEVRNGSGVPGAARKMREKLQAEGFKISRIGDAGRRWTETTLIDFTSGKAGPGSAGPNALLKLTGLIGISVVTSTLPVWETPSDADFLIILGTTSTKE